MHKDPSLSVCFQPQFPTLFINLFPIALNAEVNLLYLLILLKTKTAEQSFVSEAQGTMNPLSKSHRSFPIAILIPKQGQPGLLSIFIHTTELCRMVNCLIFM